MASKLCAIPNHESQVKYLFYIEGNIVKESIIEAFHPGSVKQFIIERVVQPSNSQILSSVWLGFHGERPSPLLYELARICPRTTSYGGQSQWQHLALSISHTIECNTADYYTNLNLTQTIRLKVLPKPMVANYLTDPVPNPLTVSGIVPFPNPILPQQNKTKRPAKKKKTKGSMKKN